MVINLQELQKLIMDSASPEEMLEEVLPSKWKEIIPDRNVDLHKGIKSTNYGNSRGQKGFLFLDPINLFKR